MTNTLSSQRKLQPHLGLVWLINICLILSPALAMAANIIRGPYLQQGTDSSVIVRWNTDTATNSLVKYGQTQGTLNQQVASSTATTNHIVKITGLTPATQYFYSVGSSTATLAGNDVQTYFKTSPPKGQAAKTRIWVLGDPGRAGTDPTNQAQQYVLNGYNTFNQNQHTDFWLMLGDNAYNDGTIEEYQNAVFNQYPIKLKQSTLWPAMGNHDNRSADVDTQQGGFYDLFSTPTQGEAGGVASNHKGYFSFDYGNIHVVVLNSSDSEHNQLSGPMDEWLKADLAASNAPWLIAIFHHAPYGKGHDSDTESGLVRMRENFLPILEQHGVDLVMAGHNHYYTRTVFMSNHYGLSNTYNPSTHNIDSGDGKHDGDGPYTKVARTPSSGTVYITHGAGAGDSSGYAERVSSEDIASGKRHPTDYIYGGRGSMVIDVDGDAMQVNVIGSRGNVVDYFNIEHTTSNNQLPQVKINGPYQAATGEAISFSSAGSKDPDGTISQYLWDFGDGNTSTLANPSHTYTSAGQYTVSLRLTDNHNGRGSATTTATINTVINSNLQNGVAQSISGDQKSESHFTFEVPANASDLNISISGGSGDADLYVKFGQQASKESYDCRPYKGGNNESCAITPVQTGTYHIMLYGYKDYQNVNLIGQYQQSDEPTTNVPDACATQAPVNNGRLENGEVQCLAEQSTMWFSIPAVDDHQNIAITTAHGTGNIDLTFSNQGWPNDTNVDGSSSLSGTRECIYLTGLTEYWGYLKVTGGGAGASIVVDFDVEDCR